MGGVTTSMYYDYSGARVRKDGSGITLYPFQGYEIDPSGTITKFIRIGGESVASNKGTSKYFYHNDHLGSVNVVSDISGARVQLNEYDPWGAVSRSEGSIDPDQRFTGQKLDPETGLYYYGGRYYDAEIGRFISADPFIQTPYDPQNLNRYSYVVNNPQNYTDPDGYFHQVKKPKKPGFFKRFFGYIIGALVFLATGDPTLAFISRSVAHGAANNGIAGAAMGLFTAGAYLINPGLGAVFDGITSEMFHTGSFGKGFINSLKSAALAGSYSFSGSHDEGGLDTNSGSTEGLRRFPALKEPSVKQALKQALTIQSTKRVEAGGNIFRNRFTGTISAELSYRPIAENAVDINPDLSLGGFLLRETIGQFHSHPDVGRFMSGDIGPDVTTFQKCPVTVCGNFHIVVDRNFIYGFDRTGQPPIRIGPTSVIIGR